MSKTSAGLILFRGRGEGLEILLVHPGGPFWKKKDDGAWFIPKGELNPEEDALAAATREFQEETGLKPEGAFLPLGSVRQKSGKTIFAWAFEGDCEPTTLRSNTFKMEWPPKSGRQEEFPEVDRAAFFDERQASQKMHPVEFAFFGRLREALKSASEKSG